MIDGESIARRFREGYPEYAKKLRKKPVDFTVIPQLLEHLQRFPIRHVWAQHAFLSVQQHLEDAANKQLPREIREQHFDIAGAILWQVLPPYMENRSGAWFFIWKEAGGV